MRVLLVSHRFPPDGVVGVERITQSVAGELAKRGDDVTIVTRREVSNGPPQTIRERLTDGTSVFRLAANPTRLDRFLEHHDELEQMFTDILAETTPDVVHFMHLLGLSPRFVAIARRQRAGVVLSMQDYFFACPLILLRTPSGALCRGPNGGRECAKTCFPAETATLRWGLRTAYFRRVMRTADRLIYPSRYVASFFQQHGADPARGRVIENGALVSVADRLPGPTSTPRDRGRLRLAFLGSLVPHKGVHVILEALQLARVGSAELLVLGPLSDPGYARRLREHAAAIPDLRMWMYGSYEPAQLPCLLHDVDCVVMPSLWPETFGIVIREALALGIPILVTSLGGPPEAVIEGENGFVFDPQRPADLAAMLQRLTQDPDLLRRLQAGARATPVMSATEHAAAVRQVYSEAAGVARGGEVVRSELEEQAFTHQALLGLGCGSRPVA